MSARRGLTRHETGGCETAGNIQEIILSRALQGCVLRLGYSISKQITFIILPMEAFD